MATPFGQEGSRAARNLGSAFGQAGSYVDSMGTPFGQTSRSTKPRKKSSDTSKMNSLYKPKASPGPMSSAANVREGRSTDRTAMPNRSNVREDRNVPKKSNFTYSAPKADKRKSNFTYSAPKAGKAKPKAKDTSFKKSGVAGVLRSPEAKKARASFNKKGLFPSLFGN